MQDQASEIIRLQVDLLRLEWSPIDATTGLELQGTQFYEEKQRCHQKRGQLRNFQNSLKDERKKLKSTEVMDERIKDKIHDARNSSVLYKVKK